MFARIYAGRAVVTLLALATAGAGSPLHAQASTPTVFLHPAADITITARDSSTADLDSLVAMALSVNPRLRTALSRAEAMRHRAVSAGTRPDPMLMAGVQNLPVSRPGFSDFMTMKMVGIAQSIPYPGKLRLQRAAAQLDADATGASLAAARLDIARQVREAYYDLAYDAHALAITARNQRTLVDLVHVAEAHYTVGTGTQADALRAQLETARLAQEASSLEEDRRASQARLNALLDRPSDALVGSADFASGIRQLAAPASASAVRFASPALGARAAGSPLLPLDSLQVLALQASPMLRSHLATVTAQRQRVALARLAARPDVSVSVEYGQRDGNPDMVTAQLSLPLPLQRAQKQDEDIAAASADLSALESEHDEQVNALDAAIAEKYSDAERARTQLALSVSAVLPQARATLASITASYAVGRTDLQTVIDTQSIVFNTEIAYYRALSDFAKAIAALEQLTGTAVTR